MIMVFLPPRDQIKIEHLVLDVNGTLALDGELLPGVAETLTNLEQSLNIHMLTADTHGKQTQIDQQLNLKAVRIQEGLEAQQKSDYVLNLGPEKTLALGQGSNDALMLKQAIIGVCILSEEGTAVETLINADLVVPDIQAGLQLLLHPRRITASLRK
jgi:P-type E1-E2 ATPase